MERTSIPPSREVRLRNGITLGWTEDYLYQAHTGTTSDLTGLMAKAELQVQHERSKAAEAVGALLLSRLSIEGYLTSDAIRQTLRDWHEEEIL